MNAVYEYDDKRVIVRDGIVVHSDTTLCQVGAKPNTAALKACGWRKAKTATVYYAHGGKTPHRFVK